MTTQEANGSVSSFTTAHSLNVPGGRRGTYRHNVVRFAHPAAEGGGLSLNRPTGTAPVALKQGTLANASGCRWYFAPLASSQYRLRNANPNVPAQGERAFRQAGTTNVQVGPCGTTSEYKWTFVGDPLAARSGFKLRNVSSGTCLENDASTAPSATLRLVACGEGFSSRQSLYLGSLQWPG